MIIHMSGTFPKKSSQVCSNNFHQYILYSNILANIRLLSSKDNKKYISSHIEKMAAVQSSKRRLACLTIVNKYKAFKEIDAGQSCIATAKKYSVAKNSFTLGSKES